MNNVIRNESVQTMAKQLKTDTITSIIPGLSTNSQGMLPRTHGVQ